MNDFSLLLTNFMVLHLPIYCYQEQLSILFHYLLNESLFPRWIQWIHFSQSTYTNGKRKTLMFQSMTEKCCFLKINFTIQYLCISLSESEEFLVSGKDLLEWTLSSLRAILYSTQAISKGKSMLSAHTHWRLVWFLLPHSSPYIMVYFCALQGNSINSVSLLLSVNDWHHQGSVHRPLTCKMCLLISRLMT